MVFSRDVQVDVLVDGEELIAVLLQLCTKLCDFVRGKQGLPAPETFSLHTFDEVICDLEGAFAISGRFHQSLL
jgi:hypothetical protein